MSTLKKDNNTVSPQTNLILNIFFVIVILACIYPVYIVLNISFSDERDVVKYGYSLFIPKHITVYGYQFIIKWGDMLIRSYILTIVVTIVGALLCTFLTALYAYPISRNDFRFKNQFTFFIFFTMLFNGGLVPWYIVCVRFLHLNNTIGALIFPYLMNAFFVIIMRTFFKTTIPNEVIESSRIDGSGDLRTFFTIVLPLSKPGLATIALFATLQYWNDYFLPLMYTTNSKLFNLQFMMYKLLINIQVLQNTNVGFVSDTILKLPSETVRMGMAIISIGPIVIAYPFFQKYFIKGLTIGAVKG